MKKRLLIASMLLGGFFAANAQNTCATALPIAVGTTTVGAIDGDYQAGCWAPPTTGTDATNGEWYSYTATADVLVRVNTNLAANVAPNSVDTRISVYTGTCGTLTCYNGSDDVNPAATGGNYLTDFTFVAEAGTTYYIVFDNRWSALGFNVELSTQSPTCATTLPFVENWETEANYYFCWESFNANSDAVAWTYNAVNDLNGDGVDDPAAMIFPPTTGNVAKDEWLVSGAHNFVAGSDYSVSVKYNGFNLGTVTANENLEVKMLSAQDPTSAGTTLGTINDIVMTGTLATLEQSATTTTYTFSPPTSGTYYLGLHGFTDAASGLLIVFETGVTGALSTKDVLASQLSVYPNPTNGVVTIANANNILVNGVTVADINGRTVKSVKFDGVAEAQVNISDLASGVYMMTIASDKGTTTKKIVKN